MTEPDLGERLSKAAKSYVARYLTSRGLDADLRFVHRKNKLPKPVVVPRFDFSGMSERLDLCADLARCEGIPEEDRVRLACEILEAPIA